jgi:hypothetical protein
MIDEWMWVWSTAGMIDRKTAVLGGKTLALSQCPPLIQYALSRERTRSSAMRRRRLTAWSCIVNIPQTKYIHHNKSWKIINTYIICQESDNGQALTRPRESFQHEYIHKNSEVYDDCMFVRFTVRSNTVNCRSQWPRGLIQIMAARLLRLWVRSLLGAWIFVSFCVVCCQVEASATSWSLVQRRPTDCGVSLYVIQKPHEWGGHSPRWAAPPKDKKKKKS